MSNHKVQLKEQVFNFVERRCDHRYIEPRREDSRSYNFWSKIVLKLHLIFDCKPQRYVRNNVVLALIFKVEPVISSQFVKYRVKPQSSVERTGFQICWASV